LNLPELRSMKEAEIRSILKQVCRELDSARAKMGVAVVGTTVALGSGCGGVVEETGPGESDARADTAQDAETDGSLDGTPDASVAEAGADVFFDTGLSDALPIEAADDGPTPVYMSACLPPDPEADPAG